MSWIITIISLLGMVFFFLRLQESRDDHEKTLLEFLEYREKVERGKKEKNK